MLIYMINFDIGLRLYYLVNNATIVVKHTAQFFYIKSRVLGSPTSIHIFGTKYVMHHHLQYS